MQMMSLIVGSLLLVAGPKDATQSKTGVYLNSVLLVGPDSHVSVHNPDSEEVDISGWSLNHESDAAKKGDWAFPEGTTVAPGESLVIANSAKGYRNARGKAPDFELATGEGVSDDENVANVESAEGAGELRVSDEDGALVLRDKEGKMRGHVSFRPESPPHVLAEKSSWNAILKVGENEMGEELHVDDQAAAVDDTEAPDPTLEAPVKGADGAPDQPTDGSDSSGSTDQPEGLTGTAPVNDAVEGAPKSDSLWTWISLILALLIAGVFLVKRRS